MKKLLIKIFVLLLYIQMPISAQTVIIPSVYTGCDSLTVKFSYTTSLTVTNVKWTFDDGTESTIENPQHTYLNPGKYLVSLIINNTDTVILPDSIKIGNTPVANFQYHDTLEFGSHNVVFNPIKQTFLEFPYEYSWRISDGASGTGTNYVHHFDTTGVYTAQLVISDILDCADTIVKTIEISNQLNIPNVFTPNGDGMNDMFIVEGDNLTTYYIQIFSRSGVKVFETASRVIAWDGRMFTGEKVRDGIYYYVIASKDSAVRLKQSGFFYIYTEASDISQ